MDKIRSEVECSGKECSSGCSKQEPKNCGVNVKIICETSTGKVLVQLSATAEGRDKYGAKIVEAIVDGDLFRYLVPRSTLLIRNLDAVSNEDEISA